MDLRLFWGVAKRYKRLSIGGALLALLLAVFAYGTPGFAGGKPTIIPRGSSTYQSVAELLITQGSGLYSSASPKTVAVGAPGYMSSLSPIYTGLANGNAVQGAVRSARVAGTLIATEGIDPLTGAYIPFVDLTASGPSPANAEILVRRGIQSFQQYVTRTEDASSVPASARVQLEIIKNGQPARLASRPKPTIPILVFMAVLAGTIALMFSMENRDPETAVKLGRVPAAGTSVPVVLPAGARLQSDSNGGVHHSDDRPSVLDRIIKTGG